MTISPLSTTFIPPSGCLSNIYRYGDNQLLGPQTVSCYPVGWSSETSTFYSPGICPSGYITACSSAVTAGSITEIHATCCPVGFQCGASGMATTPLMCNSLIGPQTFVVTVMDGDNSASATTTGGLGGYLNAYGVQIRWQASDLQKTTTRFLSYTSLAGTLGTTTMSTATMSPTPTQRGLTTGAKAGIGVGVILAALIFAALGALLLFLRKKKQLPRSEAEVRPASRERQGEECRGSEVVELYSDRETGEEDSSRQHISEAPDSKSLTELAGGPIRGERFELGNR